MAFLTRVDLSNILAVTMERMHEKQKISELKSFYSEALKMLITFHRNKFSIDDISVAVSQDWAAVVC